MWRDGHPDWHCPAKPVARLIQLGLPAKAAEGVSTRNRAQIRKQTFTALHLSGSLAMIIRRRKATKRTAHSRVGKCSVKTTNVMQIGLSCTCAKEYKVAKMCQNTH